MGVVFFFSVLTLKMFDKCFTWQELLILASAIFGSRVYLSFLKGRNGDSLPVLSKSSAVESGVSE